MGNFVSREIEYPPEFYCPIYLTVMKNPVCVSINKKCNNYYEQEAWQKLETLHDDDYESYKLDPLTRIRIYDTPKIDMEFKCKIWTEIYTREKILPPDDETMKLIVKNENIKNSIQKIINRRQLFTRIKSKIYSIMGIREFKKSCASTYRKIREYIIAGDKWLAIKMQIIGNARYFIISNNCSIFKNICAKYYNYEDENEVCGVMQLIIISLIIVITILSMPVIAVGYYGIYKPIEWISPIIMGMSA